MDNYEEFNIAVKDISVDYGFNAFEALKNKDWEELSKRLPLFLFDYKEKKTYTVMNVRITNDILKRKDAEIIVEYLEYGEYSVENIGFGMGDCDYPIYNNEKGIHEEEMDYETFIGMDIVPAYPMTAKQRNALEKWRHDEEELDFMSGKEAYFKIKHHIENSKKMKKSYGKMIDSWGDDYPDEYDYYDVPNM